MRVDSTSIQNESSTQLVVAEQGSSRGRGSSPRILAAITPAELDSLARSIASLVIANMLDQPRLVDRETIARITSTSVSTIDRSTKAGRIPCIPQGARRLYDPSDVIDAMKKGGVA